MINNKTKTKTPEPLTTIKDGPVVTSIVEMRATTAVTLRVASLTEANQGTLVVKLQVSYIR